MDWSLVKFLCHFLLLPSTLAPALLSSRRRSLVLAPGSLLFGEDVSKHGNTPRSPLSHRLPAAVPTGSAPGQAEQLNGKTTFFFSQQLSDTFFFFFFPQAAGNLTRRESKQPFFLANFLRQGDAAGGCGGPSGDGWGQRWGARGWGCGARVWRCGSVVWGSGEGRGQHPRGLTSVLFCKRSWLDVKGKKKGGINLAVGKPVEGGEGKSRGCAAFSLTCPCFSFSLAFTPVKGFT